MLVHLMDDLLAILAERDDYTGFLLDGQTIVTEDYLAVRPDRRDEIRRYVEEDRLWMGPWYVLPDTFLVSGESLLRNLARGRAQARAFGRSMDVGYIPDSFGHTAQIPQILRGFGIENAIVWRGFGGEPGQEPSEYRWRSPDGSQVLMEHLSALGYSGGYYTGNDEAALLGRFEQFRKYVDYRAQTTEILALSGGDHHWPVAELPDVIQILNARTDDEVEIVHSSLSRFMHALARAAQNVTLTEVTGELRFGYRWAYNVTGGVYSSRIYLKQANALGQRLLERYLEPLDALSVMAGARSQQPLIQHGWSYLLQNHPHDSICGCSVDPVHREMETRFEKLQELGRGVERFAWTTLASDDEGAAGDDRAIVVFNPSPFARNEVVEADVRFFRQQVVVGLNPDVVPAPPLDPVAGFEILNTRGEIVPFEILERADDFGISLNRFDYPAQSRVERFRLRLRVDDLPPLGLRALHVRRTESFAPAAQDEGLVARQNCIENEYVRVETDVRGAFFVTDKATDRRFGPLNYFEDGADAGDAYNWSPPPEDRLLRSIDGADVSFEPVEGALQVGLRVHGRWLLPRELEPDLSARTGAEETLTFATTATLTAASRHVAFETTIDNSVRDHRLRVLFETGIRTNLHHADNAFGVITREQKAYDPAGYDIEVPAAVAPMHRFVTVEDDRAGATVISDGMPEYELKHDSGGALALTLLRCVGQLGRADLMMRPAGQGAWHNEIPEAQCPGRHTFRYAFLPHAPGWAEQLPIIHRAGESFLLTPRAVVLRRADPTIDESPRVEIEPASLVLSAFKEAADGQGLILRVYNPGPRAVEGSVRLGLPVHSIRPCDLEENPQPTPATLFDQSAPDTRQLPIFLGPYKIQTFRLTSADQLR